VSVATKTCACCEEDIPVHESTLVEAAKLLHEAGTMSTGWMRLRIHNFLIANPELLKEKPK